MPYDPECMRRVRHATEAAAKETLRAVHVDLNNPKDKYLTPYKCQSCGGWHVGPEPRKTGGGRG